MEFSHIPVLLEQAVDALAVKKNGIYVDGTAMNTEEQILTITSAFHAECAL